MRKGRTAALVAIAAVTLAAAPLYARPLANQAQPAPSVDTPIGNAKARQHFDRGSRHYNLGEYDRAIAEFKAAYLLEPRLMFLWSIAQSHRLKGDYAAAIRSYEAFLRSGPSKGGAARARERIAVCKAALASAPVAPASAAGPGGAATAAPAPSPVVAATTAPPPLPPVAPLAAPPATAAGGATPVPPAPAWWRDTAGNVLVWTGVAAGAAGAALLFDGNHRMSDAGTRGGYGSYLDARDSARTLQQAGGIALAAGASLACAGALRFLYARPSTAEGLERAPAPPPSVTATAGPRGVGLAIGGAF